MPYHKQISPYSQWCYSILALMFFIMSAIGCSKSLARNGILRFYRNRLFKVFPLFVVFSVIQTSICGYYGRELSPIDYICNASTLSLWGIGGWYQEWYVCSSFALWFLLPLILNLTNVFRILLCLISIPLVGIAMLYGSFDSSYNLFLSRIPIFLYGAWLVNSKKSSMFFLYLLFLLG